MIKNIRYLCEEAGSAIQRLIKQLEELGKNQKRIDELCEKYTARQLAKMYLEMEAEKNSISIESDEYKKKCANLESELAVKENLLKIKAGIEKDFDMEYAKMKIEELEDCHQLDCIKINQLHTTIDVLVGKLNNLRRLNGL